MFNSNRIKRLEERLKDEERYTEDLFRTLFAEINKLNAIINDHLVEVPPPAPPLHKWKHR